MKSRLRVAIVHYHLRPGGVTRVIAHAEAALRHSGVQTVILAGPTTGLQNFPDAKILNDLDYDLDESPRDISAQLIETARDALGGEPDVWHFHNHSLGKNCDVPLAVHQMAVRGCRLLLHLHDFPEDGRPANFMKLLRALGEGDVGRLGAVLYPQGPHVHYAVLNGRDLGFLRAAGIGADRLHLLPDAASVPGDDVESRPSPAGPRLFLYPTRAIRRKNVGEFLLWSAIAERGDRFALTMAPTNPAERPAYERWVETAAALNVPVEFEVGMRGSVPYMDLLHSAHALVTTSVAEGFGLVYLEPWLAHRPLAGRNLPEITRDITDAGVDLSMLYHRLPVPLAWVGADYFRGKIRSGLKKYLASYGRIMSEDDVERAVHAAADGGRVDFGRLDEEMQEGVVRRAASSAEARADLGLEPLAAGACDAQRIRDNLEVTSREFGLNKYGERLMSAYESVASSRTGALSGFAESTLLDSFLAPERFFLIRT